MLELVEATFGCECELFVEFTGLLSWKAGASIDWHHDANRDYLQVRVAPLYNVSASQRRTSFTASATLLLPT